MAFQQKDLEVWLDWLAGRVVGNWDGIDPMSGKLSFNLFSVICTFRSQCKVDESRKLGPWI